MTSRYNLRSGDTKPSSDESRDEAYGEAMAAIESNDQFALIMSSLNTLSASVQELRSHSAESQRNIERLQIQVQSKNAVEALLPLPENTSTPEPIASTNSPMPNGPPTTSMVPVNAQPTTAVTYGVIPKLYDLPEFSGKPEEWPLFHANYIDTTEAFRYNDRQNLIRLRKCLTGLAKEAVAGMLIYPQDVAIVIQELEFRFGRSDMLIRSQLDKIQNFPAITDNKLDLIIDFSTKVRNIVAFLKSSNQQQHLTNPLLLESLIGKMPTSMQFDWAKHASTMKQYPSVEDCSNWLCDIAKVVVRMPSANPIITKGNTHPPRRVMHINENSAANKEIKCYHCNGNHAIAKCHNFLKNLNIEERWNVVKAQQLCFSCLRKGHSTINCRTKKPCNVNGCKRFHHPCLHEHRPNAATQLPPSVTSLPTVQLMSNAIPSSNVQTPTPASQPLLSCSTPSESSRQLFKVLPVKIYGPNGVMDIYAMFDEGSAISMIEQEIAQRMGFKGKTEALTLQWYDQNTTTEESTKITLEIGDAYDRYTLRNVYTIKNLNLPSQTFNKSNFKHFDHVPIKNYANVKPVMLLGLDCAYLSTTATIVHADSQNPIAAKTKLGWVAYGPTKTPAITQSLVLHISSPLQSLQRLVNEFIATENFGSTATEVMPESEADKTARLIMNDTTVFKGGYYETGLLWKEYPPMLPCSYGAAHKRLLGIENKMRHDEKFAQKYKGEIAQYVHKNYARKLSAEEIDNACQPVWYLPHFAVQNPHKPEKLRIVFDAAATVEGVSLNTVLLKGPERAKSLMNILFRFRQGTTGVAADIREMFSRVKIRMEDQHAQRFLWRSNPTEPIGHYVMVSMIFGAACSPCCAEFIKNHNAERFRETHPAAVNAIIEKHYVDDFVASFDDESEALDVCREVVAIHAEAGFELRNFISNSNMLEVAMRSPTEEHSSAVNMECQATSEKVLGMYWNTATDSFVFHTQFHRIPRQVLECSRPPTKRELLGIVMAVFDPFGFLADLVAFAKVLIQETWRRGLKWDDPLPSDVNKRWTEWWVAFKAVKEFAIPRPYSIHLKLSKEAQLHVFVDASQNIFAAVGYFRISSAQSVDVAFVAAKTRNAPQTLMSIPRLELQAAILGTRLSKAICQNHDIRITSVTLWSDSRTVVQWIQSVNRKYKPFVGHRIVEILDATRPEQWRWIPTELNVADDATRPQLSPQFNNKSRWLTGPGFLKKNECEWPAYQLPSQIDDLEEEIKVQLAVHNPDIPVIVDYERFSSYARLRRSLGWVIRFIDRVRNRIELPHPSEHLSIQEITAAERLICQLVQLEYYSNEINALKKSQRIPKGSSLYALSPYLEEDGLLRVSGRIDEATCLPFAARRPIILPQKHRVPELIMKYYHEKFHHQNNALILNESRQKFWIIHGRSVLKRVQRKCLRCIADHAKPVPPLMGQLPIDRVTPYVRPFTYTGVDLFGPFNVTIGRRNEKRWAVIFTCLTVRGAHIELAENLSTDAFILCLRNFVNRRGTPVRIRSDNGTNFIGAQKELNKAEALLDTDQIQDEATRHGIEWIFNCPANPSSGGCWERLIRVVKRLLQKTLHETTPRVETLRSVLIEAENIINSRPLTDIPLSTKEDEPLTPNHFLIGCANSTQTPHPVDVKICLRKQWRIAQNLKDRLWKRWTTEFLPQLIHRPTWHEQTRRLQTGDLVIICESTLPRSQWMKGTVTKVFPAKDSQVRFAEVKTANGHLRRPVSKFAVLPVYGESLENSRGAECCDKS